MATKKIKITIPDYVSVAQYQQLVDLDHLSDLEKMIKYVSVLTDTDEEEVRTWDYLDTARIYKDIIELLDIKEQFHPIFEYEGQLFGFSNISENNKQSLGQYADLENLAKNPNKNLHEIVAALYLPIKKHNFKNLVWKKLHKFLLSKGHVDNIFKHYQLEKYNTADRFERAELFKEMPFNFALGALAFFLGNANGYLSLTLPSSTPVERMRREEMIQANLNLLMNIGDGLQQFIISPNQIFSISQKRKTSLI